MPELSGKRSPVVVGFILRKSSGAIESGNGTAGYFSKRFETFESKKGTTDTRLEIICMYDEIAKPRHYNVHPSGVECIQITEWANFCLGNVIKYVWRAGEKEGTNSLTDLRKARWYLTREIERLVQIREEKERAQQNATQPEVHDDLVSESRLRDDQAGNQPVPEREKERRPVSEHCPDCQPWRTGRSFETYHDAPQE